MGYDEDTFTELKRQRVPWRIALALSQDDSPLGEIDPAEAVEDCVFNVEAEDADNIEALRVHLNSVLDALRTAGLMEE